MQRFRRSVFVLLGAAQVLVFMAAAVKPAHAYVDPGSGLLIFQVGGSMLAGALFVMRAKVRKLFRLKDKTETAPEVSAAEKSTSLTGTDG